MNPKIDTILIIEDDPGLIELINEKIQEGGHNTICFQTAASAFEWLEDNTPILMMLDYSLPDMNAQEFIGALKISNKTIAPFVVATGRGDERIAVEMMKLGAKEYIIKDTHFLEMIPFVVSKCVSEIEKDNKLLLTEQKIIELSQFNKQIIEGAHEGIVVYDKDMNYLTWNPYMERITGISANDVLGKNAIELFPFLEESGEAVNIRRAIEEKIITENEFEFNIASAGKFGWVRQTSGPLFNFKGEAIGAIATIHDITKRKKAENALLTSETRLRKALKQSSSMIQSNDNEIDYQLIADSFLEISGAKYLSFNIFNDNGLDFTTVAVSGVRENLLKFTTMLGYEVVNKKWKYDPNRATKMEGNMICIFKSLSELTGNVIPKPISTLLEKTFNLGEVAIVKITKNNTALGDFTLVYPKGETLENSELIELFANQVGLFLERKKAEKALSESEEVYRNLVQRIPDGVYKSTPDGKFVDINPAMVKMLGYESKEELLNIDIKKELYFDESHRDPKFLNPYNEEKAVFELRKKDGSGIWVEDHGWYNFDENGRKISNEGVLRDITERKKAEETLTEKMDELMRFHRLMVGRELTMIELKKEVNYLLKKAGEAEKYKIVE